MRSEHPVCILLNGLSKTRKLCVAIVVGLLVTGSFASDLLAGKAVLKNGFVIDFRGKPAPLQGLTLDQVRAGGAAQVNAFPLTMFDAVSRRYYVSQSQVDEVQLGDAYRDEFERTVLSSGRGKPFGAVGGFTNVGQFSEFGRRTVSLQGPDGPIDVVQAITRLDPQYVDLTGITHNWNYSVATETLDPVALRQSISLMINEANHEDRFAVVRFFVGAGMFGVAQKELDTIAVDFEDLQARVTELQLEIRQLRAMQFLNEFERRLSAGQHSLVYEQSQRFPRTDVNQATLQRIDAIKAQYLTELEQLDRIQAGLKRLQIDVTDPAQLNRFRDMRSVVSAQLSRATLERMTPFTQNLDDEFLSAPQKLALAYSAWVVGPAQAVTDPDTAIAYWDARDAVIEYLRTKNPLMRNTVVSRLIRIENIGPDVVGAIVANLRPIVETPLAPVGAATYVETRETADPVGYHVLLPVGYSPDRSYPTLLALHARGIAPERELYWWGGDSLGGPAHRNGFIVIAPDYAGGEAGLNLTGADMHSRIVETLRDARKRFAIDSDRVYLVGHGAGGDAVFDVGMAHPHLFAAAVSIVGRTNEYTRSYWENSESLPFYIVTGELDGDTFSHNAFDLTRMMKHRFDVVLVEYKQRGKEDYQEERPHILEWLRLHTRVTPPLEIEMKTMRESDNRFHWLELHGLPKSVTAPRITNSGRALPPRPLPIKAKVTVGNTIFISAGADRVSVWLSPEVISFDERLSVRWKGRPVFSEFPERSIETMLEHFEITGDKQRLYWQRLDF